MAEPGLISDGTEDWIGGQDAWHYPDRILPNQYAAGVNVTTQGGVLSPRPSFEELELTFEDKTFTTKYGYQRTYRDVWGTGKYQAFIPYLSLPDRYVITVINGFIWKTNLASGNTVLMTDDPDVRLSPNAARVNWSYAAESIVLFDYPNYPVIITGEKITRSSLTHTINGVLAPQIPISVLGTYNQNRLFVANAGADFTAGDPVGNLATPEAPLTFTEVFVPSAAFYRQFFSVPFEEALYSITAMGFIQALDSSTGIGQMFVATERKLYFYQTNQPRTQWTAGQFGGVLLANAGIVGPRAFVNVNSDLIFMSAPGKIHALSTARNDAKRWGNIPISREVNKYLKFNDPSLAMFTAIGYFDNRIYITANPYRVQAQTMDEEPITDYCHGGFVVLEIENIASFLVQGNPTWAGLWTGMNPMDIINVGSECYCIGKQGTNFVGANTIYKMNNQSTVDIIQKRKRRVRSVIYTRQYTFQQEYLQKREGTVLLNVHDLGGKVNLNISRKPSHSNRWLDYTSWEYEAPLEDCNFPPEELLNGIDPHQIKQLIFGGPKEGGCNPVTMDRYEIYRSVQHRLTIQAEKWGLENYKINAVVLPFNELQDPQLCSPLPVVKLAAQCDAEYDWREIEDSESCL